VTYVITEPCIGTKDGSCVDVCPVDCIHPTNGELDFELEDMLHIDPSECIDCDACVTACPVNAPFAEALVPDEWSHYKHRNAEFFVNRAS
jgi:ferredoxin